MADADPAREKPAKAKPAREKKPKPAAAAPVSVQVSPEGGAGRLAKKALLARVVEATGAKPKEVKPILEATLDVIAQALGRGESLVLPPLGRLTVRPQREGGNARVMTVKVRRAAADRPEDASQALADADEAN